MQGCENMEDRTGEWLKVSQEEVRKELESMTIQDMKIAAEYILKSGDARLRNKNRMIDKILMRMASYRSRFEFGK